MKWICIVGVDTLSKIVGGVQVNYPVGVDIQVDDETAKEFISSGHAREVGAPKPKKEASKKELDN